MSAAAVPVADESRTLYVANVWGGVYAKSIPSGDDPTAPIRIKSILTYPATDAGGDRVKPDGGDWRVYNKAIPSDRIDPVTLRPSTYDPDYVNWNHRCPIGRGVVRHQLLKNDGETATVAVGDTTFVHCKADIDGLDLRRRNPRTHRSWDKEQPYTVDDVLRVASQAERLIRDDIATGVSVEFDVDQRREGRDWWNIPGAEYILDNRPARHFEVWRGLGYAHARQPVNPGCHTIAPNLSSREGAALEKAITIAQTGKLPGGEVVCKAIMDSFADLVHYRSPNVSVKVEGTPPPAAEAPGVIVKGDSQEGMTDPSSSADSSNGTNTKATGAGHQTAMDIAQGLMDLCQRAENNGSDDLRLRKFFKKLCGKLKDIAGDVKARAEKHKGKIDAHDKGSSTEDDDDTDPMDEDDYEPTAEEKAIELDDTGAIVVKSFPNWKPRRMTFANLVPETPGTVQPTSPEPAVVTKAKRKEIRQASNRLSTALTGLSQLLDAALANGKV